MMQMIGAQQFQEYIRAFLHSSLLTIEYKAIQYLEKYFVWYPFLVLFLCVSVLMIIICVLTLVLEGICHRLWWTQDHYLS